MKKKKKKSNKNTKLIIILFALIIGVPVIVLFLFGFIGFITVDSRFSSAKASLFQSTAMSLLKDAYNESYISKNYNIDCKSLDSYEDENIKACNIIFDINGEPFATIIEGNGIYKGYCVYNGTMTNVSVVKCR